MPRFIDITRQEPQARQPPDSSSLQLDDGKLRVVGNLPHGYLIEPKSAIDGLRLLSWISTWLAKRTDELAQKIP
jgi:hypothetical protein